MVIFIAQRQQSFKRGKVIWGVTKQNESLKFSGDLHHYFQKPSDKFITLALCELLVMTLLKECVILWVACEFWAPLGFRATGWGSIPHLFRLSFMFYMWWLCIGWEADGSSLVMTKARASFTSFFSGCQPVHVFECCWEFCSQRGLLCQIYLTR